MYHLWPRDVESLGSGNTAGSLVELSLSDPQGLFDFIFQTTYFSGGS